MIPIALILGAAQLGLGLAQQGKAKNEQRESDALHKGIPAVDPNTLQHLNDIKLQRKFADSGNTRMMAYRRRTLMDQDAQTQANLFRTAGGSPGTAMDGIMRSKASTANALMGAAAQQEQVGLSLLGMQTPIIQDNADRALSLQQYARDMKHVQAATRQQSANNMMSSGVNSLAGGIPEFGKMGGSTTGTTNPMLRNLNRNKYSNAGLAPEDYELGY